MREGDEEGGGFRPKNSVFGFVNCYHNAVTPRRHLHTYLHPSTDIAKLNLADMSFFFQAHK